MDFRIDSSLFDHASVAIISSMWYKEIYLNRKKFSDVICIPIRSVLLLYDCGDNISRHLKKLTIPPTIKKHFLNILSPVGQQIISWLDSHSFLKLHESQFSDFLVWSPQGILDTRATAENILKNKDHCPLHRFRIACTNCIYKEILQLWPEVQHHYNDLLFRNEHLTIMEVAFWVFHIKNEMTKLMEHLSFTGTFEEFGLFVALQNDNYVFAKYFVEQLELHERKQALSKLYFSLIKKHVKKDTSFVFYCLSHLNHQEQMDIFIEKPDTNLLLFLYWPLQNHFLELASKLWNFLQPIDFYHLLEELIRFHSLSHWGQIYKNLFVEFWKRAPFEHKNYVIDKILNSSFLSRMYSIEYSSDLILFLLEEINPTKKLQMINSFNGLQLISFLLHKKEWLLLKFLIENCVTTCEDIDALDKIYSEFSKNQPTYINISKDRLIEFHRILKNISEQLKTI